jgi:uracil-DNA glycosylase
MLENINIGWKPFFEENKKELETIISKLDKIKDTKTIFPNRDDIFRTLFYFPPEETKLVILGQDPYISSELIDNTIIPQACGLSFSVPKCHKKIPPSLKNIYKEIKNCYPEIIIPNHGCLKNWVENEKIILLNSSLTVEEGKSNSHMKLWEKFTDKLIKFISDKSPNAIFLLMGNFAINKSNIIKNNVGVTIFTTVHPSPLSAHRGFFGSMIFKQINDYMVLRNITPIKWNN